MDTELDFIDNAYKAVLDRRRDAIIGDIYDLFFSVDEPNQVSIFDILNRLMLLLQAPAMFVLAEYDNKTKTIKDKEGSYANFNPHPRHKEKIEAKIKEAKEGKVFFDIFGAKNRRLLVLISNQGEVGSHDDSFEFTLLHPDMKKGEDDQHKIFSFQISQVLNGATYQDRFGTHFLAHLQNVVKDYESSDFESKFVPLTVGSEDEYTDLYNEFIDALTNEHTKLGLKHDGIINKAYKKSEKSLEKMPEFSDSDLEANKLKLPNFLFFIRDYSGIEERREDYNYGLRILICKRQEEAIRDFFKSLRDNGAITKESYISESFKKKDEKYRAIGTKINNVFWNCLKTDTRIEYLIKVLKHEFRKGSYSMSDPVFMSGIIQFRSISVNGGLHRSLKDSSRTYKDLNNEKKRELLRVVIVYNLFFAMARKTDKDQDRDLSVMLCPVSIGGRVLGVVSYVTLKELPPSEIHSLNTKVFEYSTRWRQNYHIYSSTHRRLKRNLRAYFGEAYVVFLSYVYSMTLRKFMHEKNMSMKSFEQELNDKFEYLTKFFSYTGISCSFEKRGVKGNVIPLFEDVVLRLMHTKSTEKKPDSFFSVFPGYESGSDLSRFVDIDKITKRIIDEYSLYRTITNL